MSGRSILSLEGPRVSTLRPLPQLARAVRPLRPAGPAEPLSLSAVLPAYNEEACIVAAVRELAAVLRALVDDFEIVVVDDGSRDATGRLLAALSAREPALHLRVVTHQRNQGYGAALASGFDAARKQLLFYTDADRQFDVRELADFLADLDESTDLVIGWRCPRVDPPLRTVNAWGWRLLVHALFGYTARDIDCAFKLFRRAVWERLTVRSRGAAFSAEFLIKARRAGFRVKERPVRHLPRTAGRATGARPAVIARALAELLSLRRELGRADAPAVPQASERRRVHAG